MVGWFLVFFFNFFFVCFKNIQKAKQREVWTHRTAQGFSRMFFPLLTKPAVLHKALHFHLGTQRHNGMEPSSQHREPSLLLRPHSGSGVGKHKTQPVDRYSLSFVKKQTQNQIGLEAAGKYFPSI